MKILFLFLCLSVPAFAQSALEPARVRIIETPKASETEKRFNRLLRVELNKLGTVRFTARSDYDIACAAIRVADKGYILGYAVSIVVVAPERSHRRDFTLSITIGQSLEDLAIEIAGKLEAAYFKDRDEP